MQQLKKSTQTLKAHHRLRLKIRNQQIEEYKQKIRSMHGLHFDQNNEHRKHQSVDMQNEQNLYKQHGIDMRKWNLGEISNTKDDKYGQIARIGMELAQLSSKVTLDSPVLQEMNGPEHRSQQIRRQYHQKLDELLHIILLMEEDSNIQQVDHEKYMFNILVITTNNSTKIHTWKMQQRCIISCIYECYLSSILKSKSYTIFTTYELQLCTDYLWNILSSPFLYSQQNLGCELDFNEVEELIMQHVVEIYNELMLKFSYQISDRDELDKCRVLMYTILSVYCQYFSRYVRELSSANFNFIAQQQKDIGNIKLEVAKSLLNLSRAIIINLNQQCQQNQTVYEQMQCLINKTIELCTHVVSIILHYPTEQFRSLEESTSDNIFGTVIGFIFQLSETVAEIGEQIGEDGRYNRGLWWIAGIRNSELVLGLRIILDKDIYVQKYIQELYNQSGLSIYLLTCIFAEYPQQIQESEFQPKLFCIGQKTKLELECLKLINVLYKRYGVVVDSENNLRLRYLQNIGDPELNVYYFEHLARIGKNT